MLRSLKLIFGLGVTLIIVSFLYGGVAVSGKLLAYGEYCGHFVAVTEGIHIQVWGRDNRNVTLYVLDFDNGYKAINERSLENVSYLFIYENVSYLEINILVSAQGWYTVLVTPSSAEHTYMRYDININRNIPHVGPFVLGIALIIFDILLVVYKAISAGKLKGRLSNVLTSKNA